MARALAACVLLLTGAGACARLSGTFTCESADECVRGSTAGTCEPTGYCSFGDPSCPSGARYVDEAPVELAGTCVGTTPDDAPPGLADAGGDAMAPKCGTEVDAVFTSPTTLHCYARVEGTFARLAANERCAASELSPANLSDAGELPEVVTALLPASLPTGAYHVGLAEGDGAFSWYDATTSASYPWATGEPATPITDRVGVFTHTVGTPFELHAWTAAQPAGVVCEEPDSAVRGASRYVHFDGEYAATTGTTVCAALGGTLAAITSDDENFFVGALVGPSNVAKIGLGDSALEGTYTWPTGEPYVYEDWGGGEPNDATAGGDEDCALLVGGGNPSWFDASCATPVGFVCEIPK